MDEPQQPTPGTPIYPQDWMFGVMAEQARIIAIIHEVEFYEERDGMDLCRSADLLAAIKEHR
jgi:hypothetical protein